MADTKTFREAMREYNANYKAAMKSGNEEVRLKQIEKAKQIQQKSDEAKAKWGMVQPEQPKIKGPNGLKVAIILFSIAAIMGISAFAIMLVWSIFFE
jgi:uncharacterized membrane protein